MVTKPYLWGDKEYTRLEKAMMIHKESALKSASYGLFQILGENYEMCGFTNVYDFVEAMNKSVQEQLKAFILYTKKRGILESLKNKDWKEAARLYNGKNYADNKYDEKFKNAYDEYKKNNK